MARKYGKKASEKIARTMHEFKRGKLRSGSGGKVTSRQQAVATGLSQARRAGYKVPPELGHAAMSLDTRVRTYLRNMQPDTEVDARGIARALGVIDPLEADYALERAERAGLASTGDGRWFVPAPSRGHAKKLDREIAEALSRKRGSAVTALSHARRKARAPRVTPYHINLTPDELRAVELASGRYAWPDMLSAYADENGAVLFTESEMWRWADDVDSDAEGGHTPFPLASSSLVDKLQRFYDSRI
jgi:hypothetical protein